MKILTPCKIISSERKYQNNNFCVYSTMELLDFNYRFVIKNFWGWETEDVFNACIETEFGTSDVFFLYDGVGYTDRVQTKAKINIPHDLILEYWANKKSLLLESINKSEKTELVEEKKENEEIKKEDNVENLTI